MKGFTATSCHRYRRAIGVWGILTAAGGILPATVVGQSALPPLPVVPSLEGSQDSGNAPLLSPLLEQGSLTQPRIPATAPLPPLGLDLRHLVSLFINESLDAGNQLGAVSYNDLYTRLLARSYGDPRPPIEVEYELIQEVLKEYGDPGDRFWDPEAFKSLLNRPRPPLQAQGVAPRTVYLAVAELTPATAQQIRQTLYTQDYSRGIILDLRG
ncbi:MAG: hypothetical protein Q6J46_04370, partial [Thermostichus sp. DG02_2_bins_29]